mmetsp:Transcript_22077/g.61866  ORF Transcript_22077/g.61866 Transcript_22077/m.61866 type:complete len:549 (+) Transcript_22077:77-1723(+)
MPAVDMAVPFAPEPRSPCASPRPAAVQEVLDGGDLQRPSPWTHRRGVASGRLHSFASRGAAGKQALSSKSAPVGQQSTRGRDVSKSRSVPAPKFAESASASTPVRREGRGSWSPPRAGSQQAWERRAEMVELELQRLRLKMCFNVGMEKYDEIHLERELLTVQHLLSKLQRVRSKREELLALKPRCVWQAALFENRMTDLESQLDEVGEELTLEQQTLEMICEPQTGHRRRSHARRGQAGLSSPLHSEVDSESSTASQRSSSTSTERCRRSGQRFISGSPETCHRRNHRSGFASPEPYRKTLDVAIYSPGGIVVWSENVSDASRTIGDVKASIAAATDVPECQQRFLIHGREPLDDEALLTAFDRDAVTLTLLRRTAEQVEWLEKVRAEPQYFRSSPGHINADAEVAFAAVQRLGGMLEYVSDDLRSNRRIVFAAVQQDGRALRFAAPSLCADHEVVLAAVQHTGSVLQHAADVLRSNREIVHAAVVQYGCALKYAAAEFSNDRELVLSAVCQDGRAIRYASDQLQADPEIQQAAAWRRRSAWANAAG